MHIKSIQLDGFKSYQKHTEITGFSDTFNAITGYNGSGKSNVLDSICFVLGITKLDNIRAKSMVELISHGGTKATVQIRFDNRNKAESPFGMEQFDEIVVQRIITVQAGGKGCNTAYTLNGHAATLSKVMDFFRQIGLNVNNPHFLIMQGRITTVLNMKPEEILGMVEEAAGTKMYDQKKKDAEKMMFLKEGRIKEIDSIFEISINPRMEKFREDRKNMVEVTRLTKVKEGAVRKYDAFQYYQMTEDIKRNEEKKLAAEADVQRISLRLEELTEDIAKKEQEKVDLDALTNNKEAEKTKIEEHRSAMAKRATAENEKGVVLDKITRSEKEYDVIRQSIAKDRKIEAIKEKELEKAQQTTDLKGYEDDEALVQKTHNDIELLTRGTVNNEKGDQVSVEHEIQDCRAKASTLEAEMRVSKLNKSNADARIQEANKKRENRLQENADLLKRKEAYKKEVDKIQNEIAQLRFDEATYDRNREKCSALAARASSLEKEKSDLIDRECPRMGSRYTPPPVHDFRPEDVLGCVGQMTFLKPGHEKYAVAADVGLGGFLQQIVVRTQDTARLLLESKAFHGRRTYIPIAENHRRAGFSAVSDRVLERAQQIAASAGETCVRLIDVIEYPECINNSFIAYVGHVFICDTLPTARKIAHNPAIKTRCITLRGDDVKANGIMSGGYIDSSVQNSLICLQPLKEMNKELAELAAELAPLRAQLKKNEAMAERCKTLRAALVVAEKKLVTMANNVEISSFGIAERQLNEDIAIAQQATEHIEESKKKLAALNEKVKNLELMKSDDKASKDKKMKELQALLAKTQKVMQQKRLDAEKSKRNLFTLQEALNEIKQQIRDEEDELENKKKEQEENKKKIPDLEIVLAQAIAEEAAISKELEDLKSNHRQRSSRLARLNKEMDAIRKDEMKTMRQKEDKEKDVKKFEDAAAENKKNAEAMLTKYEWIGEEQVHFNKKGSTYDFEGYSLNKGSNEIKELTNRIETLERSLCMRNVSNLDTCEAKVMDIKNKRERLNNDFDMLKRTIALLDARKIEELKRAHKSVNEDFGKIFSCLLPDAFAQLVAPEGKTVCDGLEVKVSFNGVMKDSLHELSGGQRSLVALSLILAMLKFKPAPLYILDEVDAALDLSHTANIGMMIRQHFQNSQFIIVSLKQGMFSNADVIFQTSFADGHSRCTRLVGAALEKLKNDKKLAAQAIEADVAVTEQPKKKSSKRAGASTDVEMDDVDEAV